MTPVDHVLAALALSTACSHGAIPGSPCTAGRSFEPWDQVSEAVTTSDVPTDGGAAGSLIAFYQTHLRRPTLPGEDCPFQPTCSNFAQQALGRHGVVGLLLVVDRLLVREHPFGAINYEGTCEHGRWRWRDPVP